MRIKTGTTSYHRIKPGLFTLWAVALMLFMSSGCALLKMFKPGYDPVGLQNVLFVKAESQELLTTAAKEESFSPYRDRVYRLMTGVERAYEHARSRPKNSAVTASWDLIRNPRGESLAGFMALWEREDILTSKIVDGYKESIIQLCDTIEQVERKKRGAPKPPEE